jgi:hypothetical protein
MNMICDDEYNLENSYNSENITLNIYYNFVKYLFYFTSISFVGISIATIFISVFLYNDYKTYEKRLGFSDSDSESESDCNSETYDEKYINEYDILTIKNLDNNQIEELKNIFVSNKCPNGIIKMCYDVNTESFWYFINNKDIPYKYLETVGRFYVIENDCKQIFIDYKQEYDKAVKVRQTKILERKEELKRRKAEIEVQKNSVFARFKSYNIDNLDKNLENQDENNTIIPEKMNRYIYKGKLSDYDEYIKSVNIINDNAFINVEKDNDYEKLDYASFKKLEEKKNS